MNECKIIKIQTVSKLTKGHWQWGAVECRLGTNQLELRQKIFDCQGKTSLFDRAQPACEKSSNVF